MKIGDKLTLPEQGWTRIDDRDAVLTLFGAFTKGTHDFYYNKTYVDFSKNNSGFKFNTKNIKKIRIIGNTYQGSLAATFKIYVNGVSLGEFTSALGTQNQMINLAEFSLDREINSIVIERGISGTYFTLDAIDFLAFEGLDAEIAIFEEIKITPKYLFSKSNTAYTIENNTLKPLGTITTANASTLFKSGVEAITKEHCILVGQQLGKAKILRMTV